MEYDPMNRDIGTSDVVAESAFEPGSALGARELWIATAVLALAATIAAFLPAPSTAKFADRTMDWLAYWSAARMTVAGEDPYDGAALDQFQRDCGRPESKVIRIWNPPHLIAVLLPFAQLSLFFSADVWMALSIIAICLCGIAWSRSRGHGTDAIVTIAAAMFFPPSMFCLQFRQISWLLLVGCVGFFVCARKRRDAGAGVFLALLTIKPHVVYLLGLVVAYWIVSERRWKVLLWAAIAIGACYAVLWPMYPDCVRGYRRILAEPPMDIRPATLGAMLRWQIDENQSWLQTLPSVVGGLACLIWLAWRRPKVNWITWFVPVTLVSMATASYGWNFDQLILLPAYVDAVAFVRSSSPDKRRRSIVGGALVIISLVALAQTRTPWSEQVYLFWFPWALAGVYFGMVGATAPAIRNPKSEIRNR